jgi:type IV pilus assembly protein PilV
MDNPFRHSPNQRGASNQRPTSSKGMTLIEVLVAMFILTTGILGAVAMQASVKKGSFDATQRSLASTLAQDILERMRSNDATLLRLNAYNGTYGNGDASATIPSPSCLSSTSLCTWQEMVVKDLYEWEISLMGADVKNGLDSTGGLVGAVACIAHLNNNVDIVISWQGREEMTDGAANNSAFAKACGVENTKRRQIVVNAFIF